MRGHVAALDGLVAEADVGGAIGFEDGGEAVATEPFDEFGEDELQLRLLRLGDDGYLRHREMSVPRQAAEAGLALRCGWWVGYWMAGKAYVD